MDNPNKTVGLVYVKLSGNQNIAGIEQSLPFVSIWSVVLKLLLPQFMIQ